MYVLLTDTKKYLVEYLLGHVALSDSIGEAKVFKDIYEAKNHQNMLSIECNINCSVNTFIN